jgi:multiple sugar transport system substrate-binding protein
VIELVGTTWNHPRGWGGVRATSDAFAREHPDVRVTWDVRTLQAFADEPIGDLSGRYDLLVIDHPAIGEAVARAALLPLDQHLDAAFLEEQARSSVGRSDESYHWQGHRWALAIDAAAQVAAYRPDLLDRVGLEVPSTWDEVGTAVAALARDGSTIAMPAIPVDAICAFLGTCRSLGEEPCASEEVVVGRDVGREALRMLRGVIRAGHPASLRWNPPTVLDRMANTDEIAYVPIAFGYANFGRTGFGAHDLRFTAGPAAAGGVPSGTLGGAGLAVSASSPHAEAACAYAAFTASPRIQRTIYVEGGGQPGHRVAWTDPAVNDATGGFFRDTLAAIDASFLRPRHDGFLRFQEEAGELVHGYLRTGDEPEPVLDGLDASYRASLVRRAEADR